jgi:hypothetical protein
MGNVTAEEASRALRENDFDVDRAREQLCDAMDHLHHKKHSSSHHKSHKKKKKTFHHRTHKKDDDCGDSKPPAKPRNRTPSPQPAPTKTHERTGV